MIMGMSGMMLMVASVVESVHRSILLVNEG